MFEERKAALSQTIALFESFNRAVECLLAQLASLETHAACGGLLARPATGEHPESSRGARLA